MEKHSPQKSINTGGDFDAKEKANQISYALRRDIYNVQMHMQLHICSLVLDFTVSYEAEHCPSFKGFTQEPMLGVDQCDGGRQLKLSELP